MKTKYILARERPWTLNPAQYWCKVGETYGWGPVHHRPFLFESRKVVTLRMRQEIQKDPWWAYWIVTDNLAEVQVVKEYTSRDRARLRKA